MTFWDRAKALLPGIESGLKKEERVFGPSGDQLVPRRVPGWQQSNGIYINEDTAMRQSAVWACLRLRADLLSTMPLNCYRKVGGVRIEVPKPRILINPSGDRIKFSEWMYMSQVELDRSGNFIGIIRERDGNNNPSRIDAQASGDCKIIVRKGEIFEYDVLGTRYKPEQIWHEKQYPVAGSHVGLSPVAYAAWTLSEYESIRQFTTDWFVSGAVPRARLKNVNEEITDEEALLVKESWRASIAMGEPFVHGSDWEYDLMQASQASADWLKAKNSDTVDIARFFGCPADLIDAAVSGQSITYANITQRNLQFLIMNLGPVVLRREEALSDLIAKPRYVKLNTNALLRMSPTDRYNIYQKARDLGIMTANEIRELEDMEPLPGKVGDQPIGQQLLIGMARGTAQIPTEYTDYLVPAPSLAPTLPDGSAPNATGQQPNNNPTDSGSQTGQGD